MAENAEIQVDLAIQQLNRFVNGFREHLHRVWKYPNKSKITQNGPQYVTEQLVSMWQNAGKYKYT